MPILIAEVQTDRPSRYLVQLCKHAAAMGTGGHTSRMHLHTTMARSEVQVAAEWSESSGIVTFTPWGQATLTADDKTLTVRIDSPDEDGLAQIRSVITRNLKRFSRRNPLVVTWQRHDTLLATPFRHTVGPGPKPWQRFPRSRRQIVLFAVAAVLVVGLHIGLASTVLADSWWTGTPVNVVLALVVLKITLVVVARFGIRRGRESKKPDQT